MTEYIDDLAQTMLFSGIEKKDITGLLECIHARCVKYEKGSFMIEEGEAVCNFGIMLSGHGRSIKWDVNGKIVIITLLTKGSEIGVMLAASIGHKSSVFVEVLEDSCVLQIPYTRITAHCSKACSRHEKLLRNYIHIVALKGLELHERINCLLKSSVREKIITYLKSISVEQKSNVISIPLNRNAMAEYLNVERSALSRELSNMKKDGLIDYKKNRFTLL